MIAPYSPGICSLSYRSFPLATEVFHIHRKFPPIFTMKKGRMRMLGSNSVPLDFYTCPLPLDHGYHVLNVEKYTIINIE
jgi:hypothetical protein